MAKEINIAKDMVEKYEPKDIIAFVTAKLVEYNKEENGENGRYSLADKELQVYIDILIALNEKLNGKKQPTIV